VLDSSAIIDARIGQLLETGLFDCPVIVPRFVIDELQHLADSRDRTRRLRGRLGLDHLHALRTSHGIDVDITFLEFPEEQSVDRKLIALAKARDARLVTVDWNLLKVADVEGIAVVNPNELSQALRPTAVPGGTLTLRIVKAGEERGQGVGYLEDGTMVVVDGAREAIGTEVPVVVRSFLQTSAGRLIFARLGEPPAPPDEPDLEVGLRKRRDPDGTPPEGDAPPPEASS
jgi:uncharacterized protein YacL